MDHHDDETTRGGAAGAAGGLRRQGQERRGGRCRRRPVEHIEMDPDQDPGGQGPGRHPPRDLRRRPSCSSRPARRCRRSASTTRSRDYDQLLKEFPDTRYHQGRASTTPASPTRARRTGQTAVARVQEAGDRARRTRSDAKDALVPAGRLLRRDGELAGLGDALRRDPRAQGPERRRQDRGDGRGAGSPSSSSRTWTPPSGRSQSALYYFQQHREGRAPADRLLSRPRAVPPGRRSRTSASGRSRCGCPRSRWAIDMDDKARLLLSAQRQYIETIKLGNPQWASASGLPGRVAVRGVLRRLHPRADPARAAGRRATRRSARSTTRSCGRRSASCWRSRCARTSRTC